MSGSDVIGVVILARHGDREGFYQDPITYTASATKITALGNVRGFDHYAHGLLIHFRVGTRVPAWTAVSVDVHQCIVPDLRAGNEHCALRSNTSTSSGRWRRRARCHLRLVYICGPRFMAGNVKLQFDACQRHDCPSASRRIPIRSKYAFFYFI